MSPRSVRGSDRIVRLKAAGRTAESPWVKLIASARAGASSAHVLLAGCAGTLCSAALAGCPALPALDPLAPAAAAATSTLAGRRFAFAAALASGVARFVAEGAHGVGAVSGALLALAGCLVAVLCDPPPTMRAALGTRDGTTARAEHVGPDRPEDALHADLAALNAGVRAAELDALIGAMRATVAAAHAESRSLVEAAAELQSGATASLAVIEGGALAQRQLEDGIAEQARIVDGALVKVRAMTDAIASLAGSAEQQTRALDQTALDASSMSAAIEEVAAQVDSLLGISTETTATAERGGAAIHTIVEAMSTIKATIAELAGDIRRLGTNSAQIGEIVRVIDGIAEQTNLLALNAAIEAARAGEHGRGFAVVATEIRKLADGSVQATKEIAGHVGSTQAVIGQVTAAMQRLDERLEESVRSTDNASEALRAIVAAVLDANRQIAQIGEVTRAMSENAFRVVGAIQEIATSVAATLGSAQEMAAHSHGVSEAFDAITSVSSQNTASVEVLTIVNAEVTSAAQSITSSVEGMNRRAAAIEEQLERCAGGAATEGVSV